MTLKDVIDWYIGKFDAIYNDSNYIKGLLAISYAIHLNNALRNYSAGSVFDNIIDLINTQYPASDYTEITTDPATAYDKLYFIHSLYLQHQLLIENE